MRGIRFAAFGWLLLPLAAFAVQSTPATPATAASPGTSNPAATSSDTRQHGAPTGGKGGADPFKAWRARTIASLTKRGDVDGYFGAAMLVHGDQRGPYVRDASRVAPDDPDAAWMKWWCCSSIPGCDRAAVIAHIRKLEPENAAAWIPDVKAAMSSGDPFKVTEALNKVASLDHFDDHAWSIGRRAGLATIALPPPPPGVAHVSRTERLVYDMANVGGFGMGGVYSAMMACPNLLFFEARLRPCQAVAGLLQRSGRRQYEGIGLGLAYLLLRPEAYLRPEASAGTAGDGAGPVLPIPDRASATANPEVAAVTARYRTYVWRTLKWVRLQLAIGKDPTLARVVPDAIRSQSTESAMIATVLKERGIPLAPPNGWEPASAASSGK